jgi:hypothetical protein
VVVFAHVLKRIGDVSQLQNKVIEVHGPVKEYDGRAEIVLQQMRQLGGEGLGIPRLPKNYDVENKGHYSAGSFSLRGFSIPALRRALKHLLPTKFATWDTTTGLKPAALPLFRGEVLCPRNHNH